MDHFSLFSFINDLPILRISGERVKQRADVLGFFEIGTAMGRVCRSVEREYFALFKDKKINSKLISSFDGNLEILVNECSFSTRISTVLGSVDFSVCPVGVVFFTIFCGIFLYFFGRSE